MTIKSIKLLSSLSVCAIAASITIASCDKSAEPTGPSKSNGKPPQVLSECAGSMGSTFCPVGSANAEFDEYGVLNVNVANKDNISDGVDQTFDGSASSWSGVLGSIQWPSDGKGVIAFSAKDDENETVASLTFKQKGESLSVYPFFASSPGGDVCNYDVIAYRGGQPIARQQAVPMTMAVNIPIGPVLPVYWTVVQQELNQCQYNILVNGGTITLPDGTVVTGADNVTFKENSPNGVYVYTATKTMGTLSNMNYRLQSSMIPRSR